MADLVFRSTTRGGRDYFEVTDYGMIYGGNDRYRIKTDNSMHYVDTVDEVLAELVFLSAWRNNYDKIEVDDLGIGKEYKEITKLIRKKYNWLYNLPKGSEGRQFYYDIGLYFNQELKKGTDYNKIFDKIDDIIERSNFTESKIKTMNLKNKNIVEGMRVTYGKYKLRVVSWDKSYTDCLLNYLDSKGNRYVVAQNYELSGTEKDPQIDWLNGRYFTANSDDEALEAYLDYLGIVNRYDISESLKESKKSLVNRKLKENLSPEFADLLRDMIYSIEALDEYGDIENLFSSSLWKKVWDAKERAEEILK